MRVHLAKTPYIFASFVLVAYIGGSGQFCAAAADKSDRPAATDAPDKGDAARPRRQGQWIRIPLPIDHSTVVHVEQTMQRVVDAAHDERPIFVLEFVAPEGAADAGQGTQFDDAHSLASYLISDKLNGANTVAYIPRTIKGHAVLPVIACDTIIMATTATMGDAGADEKTIGKTLLAAYEEIARARHSVAPAVALGMLDKGPQVLKVKTEGDVQYATRDQLPEIEKKHRILDRQVIKQAGEPWQFTGAEARDWGIIPLLADDRRDVIRQMQLSPDIVAGDPSNGRAWKPIRVELKGPVKADKVEDIRRIIHEETGKGANFVCLWIDSPGGAPLESSRLAKDLADLPRDQVRTVAYIDNQALADAALIALGCDQIVMHPRAILGGPGQYQMKSQDEINTYQGIVRDPLARLKMRSWSLWAAMFNPNLDVYRCRRLGDVDYFCEEELRSRQPLRDKGEKGTLWQRGERVTTPGRVHSLTGDKALEYGVATAVVENFGKFKQKFGLENDPTLIEPGWVDALAHFLGRKEMVAVLIFLGALGIYIELHAPGTGIGAFMAVVAFALFFWSGFLEGTAGWLEVTLFVTGCICLLTEIFVLPGFIVFGLGGGGLILASIILASQTFFFPQNEYQVAQLQGSLYALAFAVCGLIGAIWLLNHWLPRAPVLQHVFLAPPEGEEAEIISRREMLVDLDNLIGQIGQTTTPLSPAGKARFGNHLVDVISTGEFIARDSQVVVAEVHGNRVVVRAAGAGDAAKG
jgi:membrane-bound ClpP family serine protease